MDYKQAIEWLHGLPRVTTQPGPQRMCALLTALGNPQRRLRFIHIAGTNGKGSTTVMLASVLREAGYTVGAMVSPYVMDFRERFQINGSYASQQDIAAALTKVHNALAGIDTPVIEFMAVTAAAFLLFEQAACDLVCLEAGIGGLHDDTNIIENTLVACITKVDLDHTELLGQTVEQIAAEKCGIFKNQCAVISYPDQSEAVKTVVRFSADKAGCALTVPNLEDFYFYESKPFDNRCNYGGYDLQIPFAGIHQCLNASVVVEAALALWHQGYAIEDEHIIQGIARAILPARIQLLSSSPLLIVDGAHNLNSMQALARTLKMEKATGLTAIVGVLGDKNASEMLHQLAPYVNRVYAVTPASPRALPAARLAEIASGYIKQVYTCNSFSDAFTKAARRATNGILVCGSLYLAGEMLDKWHSGQFRL